MTTTARETMPGHTLDQRLMSVPIGNLHPDPDNPRVELGDVDELAASLDQVGMLQPIIARRAGEHLVVVAGHRRLAAARIAGWDKVPVIVRPPMRTDDVLVAMLVENGQRRDLDPVEEARALARLMKLEGLTRHAHVATRIGRHQSHVSSRLALLALSPADLEEVRAGQMKLVEATEKARMSSGRVRPQRDPARLWFGASHDLAPKAKARCSRLSHKRGNCLPGGIACPECYESVIRADERQHLNEHQAVHGQFPTESIGGGVSMSPKSMRSPCAARPTARRCGSPAQRSTPRSTCSTAAACTTVRSRNGCTSPTARCCGSVSASALGR